MSLRHGKGSPPFSCENWREVPSERVELCEVQWLSKVLTPWVGWGGVGSAEVADRALRLSRPDALMPSTAPGKARCAELFPPGARHLVTLGNVADRYTHPDDQPDPPETLQ
jgi:hypothetical protein